MVQLSLVVGLVGISFLSTAGESENLEDLIRRCAASQKPHAIPPPVNRAAFEKHKARLKTERAQKWLDKPFIPLQNFPELRDWLKFIQPTISSYVVSNKGEPFTVGSNQIRFVKGEEWDRDPDFSSISLRGFYEPSSNLVFLRAPEASDRSRYNRFLSIYALTHETLHMAIPFGTHTSKKFHVIEEGVIDSMAMSIVHKKAYPYFLTKNEVEASNLGASYWPVFEGVPTNSKDWIALEAKGDQRYDFFAPPYLINIKITEMLKRNNPSGYKRLEEAIMHRNDEIIEKSILEGWGPYVQTILLNSYLSAPQVYEKISSLPQFSN